MKNITVTLFLVIAMATVSKAQFAIEAGLNMSKLTLKDQGTTYANQFKKGAAIGMLADLYVDNKVYLEPGVFAEMAGAQMPNHEGDYEINTTNVQLDLEYKTGDKCGSRFFAGGGPTIIYIASGFLDYGPYDHGANIGPTRSDDLKKRGLGLNGNIGFIPKKHFYVRARFLMSLSNMKPLGNKDNKVVPMEAGLNLGWFFSRCKPRKERYGSTSVRKPNHWRGLSKGVYSRRVRYPRYPQN